MNVQRVLITDIAWPDDAVERSVLEPLGFVVELAPSGDEATLVAAARADGGVTAIVTCFAKVTAAVIDASPRLKVVSRTGVGVDNIDVERCEARCISVTRVPDYCVDEVATHTMALALSLWRRIPTYSLRAQRGGWGSDPGSAPVHRLTGRRVAVLGRGRIGSEVARRWEAFGVDLTTDADGADVVCLHLPLTTATQHVVDDEFLAALAPGAVLVNTGRGGLIDEGALLRSLDAGHLSAAALDVFHDEPLPSGSPLRGRSDILLTPHVAFYSDEALIELRTRAAQNVLTALGISSI